MKRSESQSKLETVKMIPSNNSKQKKKRMKFTQNPLEESSNDQKRIKTKWDLGWTCHQIRIV